MRILCIGDSNTWGFRPEDGGRHERRWTKVLAELMPECEIIEEGMNGRTLLSVDPLIPERCGISSLKMLLMSHKPVDCVVVMLGTNELKTFFEGSADFVANGVKEFIKVIQVPQLWERFHMPEILIISPILIHEELIRKGDVFGDFDERSVEQSKLMAKAVSDVCDEYRVHFMNAAEYAAPSVFDNIHMDENNHEKLALAVNAKLKEVLKF